MGERKWGERVEQDRALRRSEEGRM